MTDTSVETIQAVVSSYRIAMESISTEFDLLESFPRGCCGLASTVLANCLSSMLKIETTYYWIQMTPSGTHAWLMYDGNIVIDPTVDQFSTFDLYSNDERIVGTTEMDGVERRIFNRVTPMLGFDVTIDPRLVFTL